MSCALYHRILQHFRVLGDDLFIDQSGGQFGGFSYQQAGKLIARLNRAVSGSDKPPVSIGVLSNHRAEAYLSILYAFLRGIKFVPMNPGLPAKRLQRIVDSTDRRNTLFLIGKNEALINEIQNSNLVH